MFGNKFTALDAILAPNMFWLVTKRDWLKKDFPALQKYYERLKQRKSF